ncbi:hypothetical protein GCM10028803_12150 [Larkinella knui]|uniref:DUF2975 domain-containing protein n=1 Tax=Larkinella knui TaxID=2025310 RepID=A0A3P1CCL4_9BACT|nr:DUF2975 domain-containing protein [Larkinella knui]RRB10826.1 DUF2975 domain-containing protein [Larkinella knui]
MKNQSPAWVFPTVKWLVTVFYYFVLVVLVVFTLMCSLKFLGAQTGNFSIKKGDFFMGQEPPNYVSVPVAWGPASTKMRPSSGEPQVFLKPQKETGQLQVPVRSTPGILIITLGLVGLGTAVWTFSLLRKIFRTVQTQSPFHPDNARRINTMGLLFLGQTGIELLLKMALWSQTRPYFQQIRLDYQNHLSVDINLDSPWLLGLILLALAQVYRRGIDLQTENELTV